MTEDLWDEACPAWADLTDDEREAELRRAEDAEESGE
jgi:hypothetical protein